MCQSSSLKRAFVGLVNRIVLASESFQAGSRFDILISISP